MKIAVVTPYFKPDQAKLVRCLDSVSAQTVKVVHYLVSDGEREDWLDAYDIVHMALPSNIGSTGATPRGLGALTAFHDGFDAVTFLDADNYFDPSHIAQCVALQQENKVDLVFARRHIFFPDGEVLKDPDPQDGPGGHVDANCYFITKSAAFLVGMIGMYPREFGAGEDRPTPLLVQKFGLTFEYLDQPTVWYETNWEYHYQLAGKAPVGKLREPLRRYIYQFSSELYRWFTGQHLIAPSTATQAETPTLRAHEEWNITLISSYDNQTAHELRIFHESVLGQTQKVSHMMVANGFPNQEVLDWGVEHFVMPRDYQDQCALGQGLAGMFSFKLGCDAVIFFNQNHLMMPTFIKSVSDFMQKTQADIVFIKAEGLDEAENKQSPDMTLMMTRKVAFMAMLQAQLSSLSAKLRQHALLKIAEAHQLKVMTIRSKALKCKPLLKKQGCDQVDHLPSVEEMFSLTGYQFSKKSQALQDEYTG
jgi:hypothetical protein